MSAPQNYNNLPGSANTGRPEHHLHSDNEPLPTNTSVPQPYLVESNTTTTSYTGSQPTGQHQTHTSHFPAGHHERTEHHRDDALSYPPQSTEQRSAALGGGTHNYLNQSGTGVHGSGTAYPHSGSTTQGSHMPNMDAALGAPRGDSREPYTDTRREADVARGGILNPEQMRSAVSHSHEKHHDVGGHSHGTGVTGHGTGTTGHDTLPTGHGIGTTGHGTGPTGHGTGLTGHGTGLTGHGTGLTGHGDGRKGHGTGLTGHDSGVTSHHGAGITSGHHDTNLTGRHESGFTDRHDTGITGRRDASDTDRHHTGITGRRDASDTDRHDTGITGRRDVTDTDRRHDTGITGRRDVIDTDRRHDTGITGRRDATDTGRRHDVDLPGHRAPGVIGEGTGVRTHEGGSTFSSNRPLGVHETEGGGAALGGIHDAPTAGKPNLGDKIIGKAEKAMGKVLANPEMQEKGELRETGGSATVRGLAKAPPHY